MCMHSCECVCMYLSVFVYVCSCMHVCVLERAHVYIWVSVPVCYMCLYAYPYMGVCVPVYMECMFVFMSACHGHVCMCQSCSSWFFPSIIWVPRIEFSHSLLSHLASSRTQILNPLALLLILNTELIQDDLFSSVNSETRSGSAEWCP